MRRLSCSVKLNRLKLAKIGWLALTIAVLGAHPPAFAGTPDWLRQAAAMPLPAYPKDTDAVVLLDERSINVSSAGEVRTTYRKAYRILRPGGRARGTLYVYFDNETALTFLKGWSVTSQGEEYEVKESDAVETAAFSEGLYADTRYKLLRIPASQPGTVVGYEYQQRARPSVLQTVWSFQDEIPVRRARLSLEIPPNWIYTVYWRNHTAVNPQSAGENRWTWELADVEAIESEAKMPIWHSVAGQMGISFALKTTTSADTNPASWAQIGQWYEGLSSGRREITPQIREKTKQLLAGTDDPLEKIQRLASFVQHGIRYVAIEIGIGGYQPHAAQEVLASGYGDCKDKATLLSAMLREAGVDSYFVLINADRDYLAPDFPTPLSFNHAILAIRLPQTVQAPGLFAVLAHATLGHLLLFDPTDTSTPFGYLPPDLQANHGLLVADKGGDLLSLPLLPPSTNRLLRSATLTLDEAGNLQGTVDEIHMGPSATELRNRLLNLPAKQRQKAFEDLLSSLLDGAVLTGAAVSNLKDYGGSFSIRYDLKARAYAQHAGQLVLFHSCVLGRKSSDLLEGKSRKQTVVFPHAVSESDVFDISFPAKYSIAELPQSVKYEHPFASYRSELRAAEHVLHYSRTYELRDVRVPVERLEDLKNFFREIADDERGYTILALP